MGKTEEIARLKALQVFQEIGPLLAVIDGQAQVRRDHTSYGILCATATHIGFSVAPESSGIERSVSRFKPISLLQAVSADTNGIKMKFLDSEEIVFVPDNGSPDAVAGLLKAASESRAHVLRADLQVEYDQLEREKGTSDHALDRKARRLEELADADPLCASVAYEAGEAARCAGRFDVALRCLEKAGARGFSDLGSLNYDFAFTYFGIGDMQKAGLHAMKALDYHEVGLPELHILSGYCIYHTGGDISEAKEHLARALRLDSKSIWALETMAEIANSSEDWETLASSVAGLKEAAGPTSREFLRWSFELAIGSRGADDILAAARERVRVHPDDVDALWRMADVEQKRGKPDRAIKRLEKILALGNRSRTVRERYCDCLIQVRNFERALTVLASDEADPEPNSDLDEWYLCMCIAINRIVALQMMKRYGEALAECRVARNLILAPQGAFDGTDEFTDINFKLDVFEGWVLLDLGKKVEALPILERAAGNAGRTGNDVIDDDLSKLLILAKGPAKP